MYTELSVSVTVRLSRDTGKTSEQIMKLLGNFQSYRKHKEIICKIKTLVQKTYKTCYRLVNYKLLLPNLYSSAILA